MVYDMFQISDTTYFGCTMLGIFVCDKSCVQVDKTLRQDQDNVCKRWKHAIEYIKCFKTVTDKMLC